MSAYERYDDRREDRYEERRDDRRHDDRYDDRRRDEEPRHDDRKRDDEPRDDREMRVVSNEGGAEGMNPDGLIESNWDEVCESFDDMSLDQQLLRGIYSYGFEKPSAIRCELLFLAPRATMSSPRPSP